MATLTLSRSNFEKPFEGYNFILKQDFCISYSYGRRRNILKTLITYISCMKH